MKETYTMAKSLKMKKKQREPEGKEGRQSARRQRKYESVSGMLRIRVIK